MSTTDVAFIGELIKLGIIIGGFLFVRWVYRGIRSGLSYKPGNTHKK